MAAVRAVVAAPPSPFANVSASVLGGVPLVAAVRTAVAVPPPAPADEQAEVPAAMAVPSPAPTDEQAAVVTAGPSPPAALGAAVRDEDGECVRMDVASEEEVEDVVMGELFFLDDDMEVEPEV